MQHFNAARTNAARRKVDDAQKAGVVVRVLQQAQVGQRVLDFGAFKKAQATIHTVGHAGIEQGRFNHPALRVAAVEHGDFLALKAVAAHQLLDLVHHPLRLGQVRAGLVHAHGFARALRGAQVLAQAAAVVADEVVGRVEDVAVAAVVLLQLDLVLHIKLAHKVGHVAHACAAKGVDALVVVTHGHHAGVALQAARHFVARHLLEPQVLQAVGVLKLIDQDVAKAPLVVLANRIVVAQQLVRAQHQLAKIHHAFALALLFVKLVKLDLLAAIGIVRGHIAGAHALFLATRNKVGELLGRKALFIHIELLAQPLDGRELVLRVQNLKRLRQARSLVVRAQKAVAQPVEGANPHAAHVHRQHGGEARHHFLGGLVGEGDGQNAAGRSVAVLQQPRDAGGEHARLARARARQNQGVPVGQGDGGELFGVEASQQGRRSRHAQWCSSGWGHRLIGRP